MTDRATCMGLVLDDDALQTPEGAMPLAEMTRAEFVREVHRGADTPSTTQTSGAAVAGGAVVGGVLLGPAGAVGGALLGSTVKEEAPGEATFHTTAVYLVFETPSQTYRVDVPRDEEDRAYHFAREVDKARKHLRR